MAPSTFDEELAFAHRVADRAAEIALELFLGEELEVRRKPDMTLVTRGDTTIERMVREELAAAFPQDLVVGEEEGGTHVRSGRVWIVDPIDGTAGFARGVPVWATLIALHVDGGGVLGLANAPALGERYVAVAGGGATMNGAPIHVSQVASVGEAHVLHGELGELLRGPARDGALALFEDAWRNRAFGDFWGHVLVARGAAEVMIEPELSLWDYAALEVIVREAGGRVSTFDGSPLAHGGSMVTSNGLVHDEVVARLTG
jgi:histidinol-phosphatase